MPHTYPLEPEESLINIRLLSKEAKKEAKSRIKALEKRDNDKLKTDEAKNEFESLIYEFKDWLNDDENSLYDSPNGIEDMIKECDKNMEWYEDAGNEVGYKEYQTKAYSLSGDFSKLKIRKAEHKFRQENLEVVIENLTNMKSNMQ